MLVFNTSLNVTDRMTGWLTHSFNLVTERSWRPSRKSFIGVFTKGLSCLLLYTTMQMRWGWQVPTFLCDSKLMAWFSHILGLRPSLFTLRIMEAGLRISYMNHIGTIRFSGPVEGTSGAWLGIEWDDPKRGKHDGSKDGKQYFKCLWDSCLSVLRSLSNDGIQGTRCRLVYSIFPKHILRQLLSRSSEIQVHWALSWCQVSRGHNPRFFPRCSPSRSSQLGQSEKQTCQTVLFAGSEFRRGGKGWSPRHDRYNLSKWGNSLRSFKRSSFLMMTLQMCEAWIYPKVWSILGPILLQLLKSFHTYKDYIWSKLRFEQGIPTLKVHYIVKIAFSNI